MPTSASPLHLYWTGSASRPRRVAVAQLTGDRRPPVCRTLMPLINRNQRLSTVFTLLGCSQESHCERSITGSQPAPGEEEQAGLPPAGSTVAAPMRTLPGNKAKRRNPGCFHRAAAPSLGSCSSTGHPWPGREVPTPGPLQSTCKGFSSHYVLSIWQ